MQMPLGEGLKSYALPTGVIMGSICPISCVLLFKNNIFFCGLRPFFIFVYTVFPLEVLYPEHSQQLAFDWVARIY